MPNLAFPLAGAALEKKAGIAVENRPNDVILEESAPEMMPEGAGFGATPERVFSKIPGALALHEFLSYLIEQRLTRTLH